MAETTETERAIEQIGSLASHNRAEWGLGKPYWDTADAEALRHLISEARKVEQVRAKYATLRPEIGGENYDAAQAWDEAFHEAWEDVMAILSAPDTEGGAKWR